MVPPRSNHQKAISVPPVSSLTVYIIQEGFFKVNHSKVLDSVKKRLKLESGYLSYPFRFYPVTPLSLIPLTYRVVGGNR